MINTVRRACAPLLFVLCGAALGGPGHDHGEDKPVAGPNVAPRFSAHSELFELTGVVGGRRITLYLDEYATNRPIGKAAIEIEIREADGAARKVRAVSSEGDTFVVELPVLLVPGAYALTAEVSAAVNGKEETDLLATTLEIPAPDTSAAEAGHHHGAGEWPAWLAGGSAGAVLLWLAMRFVRVRRGRHIGSAA
ncbi:MAG: hypothetical protein JNM79_25455 [Burkholderiales bacterium]|nr:hypothetical protein [Burkholderiales bacterium]